MPYGPSHLKSEYASLDRLYITQPHPPPEPGFKPRVVEIAVHRSNHSAMKNRCLVVILWHF
jgi:hypothetical protein